MGGSSGSKWSAALAGRWRRLGATFVFVVCATFLAAACSSAESPRVNGDTAAWLAEYDLDGLDSREVVERLDSLLVDERPEGLMASVQSEVLVVSDDGGRQTALEMPEDEFYLSVAPYVDQTHECHYHALTSCLGELGNEEVRITVTDSAGDAVILDELVRTFDNGFAGIWLPRDIDATLTVERGNQAGSVPISTGADDPTCLTTLQLV
ncbi:CueP family metal-binding protein [Nesterenkonia sp. PF2B19]|uniref:CueP family metal-binding protein n=1 Tax=Nesterenkonia sp. PF2B19 TaxID=1881858 RepID=UPI00111C6D16|nr:CueP family metal-binding protein [Nesterenkonia sp. PF2B19]